MDDIFKIIYDADTGFWSFMFWLIPTIMFLTIFPTLFMEDLGIVVSKAQYQLTAICFGIGTGILLYRVFVIAYNDIRNTLKTKETR